MTAPLRLFMAPQTSPGQLTLQATASTWRTLADQLEATERGRNAARPNLGPVATIRAALLATKGQAIRVTLPEEQARALLRLAGVSA